MNSRSKNIGKFKIPSFPVSLFESFVSLGTNVENLAGKRAGGGDEAAYVSELQIQRYFKRYAIAFPLA